MIGGWINKAFLFLVHWRAATSAFSVRKWVWNPEIPRFMNWIVRFQPLVNELKIIKYGYTFTHARTCGKLETTPRACTYPSARPRAPLNQPSSSITFLDRSTEPRKIYFCTIQVWDGHATMHACVHAATWKQSAETAEYTVTMNRVQLPLLQVDRLNLPNRSLGEEGKAVCAWSQ